MATRHFMELLKAQWNRGHFVCVGLDSEFGKIPHSYLEHAVAGEGVYGDLVRFNHDIIEATHEVVCAYKPNIAFYEAQGDQGILALIRTVSLIHEIAPDVPVILDAKRADIGNTNRGYVAAAFDVIGADAITVHPYLGAEALAPFLEREDKGVIVLCRTSNKGAGEFQDLTVLADEGYAPDEPLYMRVARNVRYRWNKNGNCGLVVGATYPEELAKVRAIVGYMPILIPGIGTQGGDVKKTVENGRDEGGQGMIINASSSIIFAKPQSERERPVEASRRSLLELHYQVESYRRPGLI
jgi:orotidine-5'-phosphate decarboxylase